MTEAEWLACADSEPMLAWLKENGRASERKLRLHAAGCCRVIWHLLVDERMRTAVAVAERYADGLTTKAELKRTRKGVELARYESITSKHPWPLPPEWDASWAAEHAAMEKAYIQTAESAERAVLVEAQRSAVTPHRFAAALLRDICGPLPFRPVVLASTILAPDVVTLARTIYEERAFGRMPELADALERAGCTDADVLAHCRGPGPHARGCWVVDLVLGKE